jgi:hypothetical protein
VKGDTGEVTTLDELSFSGLPTSQIIQNARVIALDSQTEPELVANYRACAAFESEAPFTATRAGAGSDETVEVDQGAFSNQIDLKHPRKQRHRETA